MIETQVTPDPRSVRDAEESLKGIRNGFPRVMTRSINRTAVGGRALIVKAVAANAGGLKQKEIRGRIDLTRATFTRLSARIRIRDKAVPMIAYGARDSKSGGVTVNAPEGTINLPRAFILQSTIAGRKAVVQRAPQDLAEQNRGRNREKRARAKVRRGGGIGGDTSHINWDGPLVGRNPLIERYGPSILTIYERHHDQVQLDVADRLEREILTQTTLLIRQHELRRTG